ncbi:MAG TPA: ankyrin repeat domain-containing protein [Burkholderiaceae bacterium]|nr:ankyrin repeat domain-containing protein [Burkholderiaceae bacterium]
MFKFKNKISNSASRRRFLLNVSVLGAATFAPILASAAAYDDFFKAIHFDDVGQVRALLQRGMDSNTAESVRGETGLMVALREKAMKVFDLLLNARDINLEARAKNGDTALMIAAFTGNKPAVEALLAHEAEVNQTGWTALHYAAATGNNEIVQLLLEQHAYIDAESPNKTTPIMMAARGGHILTVKLLLDEGADATLKNDLGMTAIDFARQHGKQDIVDGLTYRLKKAGKL